MPNVSFTTVQAAQAETRDQRSWSIFGSSVGPITYGFQLTAPAVASVGHDDKATFSQFMPSEKIAAETAIRLWSNSAKITFSEINANSFTDSATILFRNYSDPSDGAGGFASSPITKNLSFSSSEGNIAIDVTGIKDFPSGSYAYMVIQHELGHALGLQHPGNYNAGPGITITYENNADFIEDTRQFSIMSYFEAAKTGANHSYLGKTIYASTPLLNDIASIQLLYGANTSYATGDNVYGFNANCDAAYSISGSDQQVVYCVWDSGGNDTLDFSGYSINQNINLNQGAFSDVGALTKNISIAYGAIIENATGGFGDDILIGNDVANRLLGGAGTDTITGGKGNDYIDGGVGSFVDYKAYTIGALKDLYYNSSNSHFYQIVDLKSKTATWDEANILATGEQFLGKQGHLVSITSTQEQDFVGKILSGVGYVAVSGEYTYEAYIGLKKINGVWNWVSSTPDVGEPFSYQAWASSQPDGATYLGSKPIVAAALMAWFNSTDNNLWRAVNTDFNNFSKNSNTLAIVEFDTSSAPPYTGDNNVSCYSGAAAQYKIDVSKNSIAVADKVIGRDGTDTLLNIQNIKFSDKTLDTKIFMKTISLPKIQIASLVELYIASFNRAPDSVGLNYWGSRLSDGMSLQDIANSFFVQTETVAAYPTNMATNEFVTRVYNNVLSRVPDTDGLKYWSSELTNGKISKDSFLLAIINGAKASTGSAIDRQTLANKEAVGEHYAIFDGLNNSTNWARDVMSGVTNQLSTLSIANTKADAYALTAANPLTSDLIVTLVGISV